MGSAWLIIESTGAGASGARYDLKPGLTMLGGVRGDLAVPSSGSDCVHLWSEPPKLIFVGAGEPPRVNGQAALELALHTGDRIEWREFAASFGHDDGQAHLEELAAAGSNPVLVTRSPAPANVNVVEVATPAVGSSAWRWLKAGLVAEMSLGDRAVIKRWQDAVARGEFDAEAASRDLLAAAPGVGDGDPRLMERCTRLMRDLLMSSVTKNPMRQVRKAARNGLAFLLVQTMILALFTLFVLAGMLMVHSRFGHSIDAFLDSILDLF